MQRPPEVTLPHDDQIEREILGSCFSEDSSIFANVRAIVSVEEFYLDHHQRVFRSMCRLADAREPIGVPTLHSDMNAHRDKIGISELAEFLGLNFAYGIDSLLRRAKDLAKRRRLIWQAREVAHHAADLAVPLGDSTSAASMALKDAASDETGEQAEDVGGIIEELGGITSFMKPRFGIQTPWVALNHCLGGWQRGDLILIGARPSMGKTALMLNAIYGAANNGVPAVVYSYEMTRESLIMRLVSMLTGVAFLDLQQGDLTVSERRAVADAISKLAEMPLRIKQASGKTALAIRVHAERLKHKGRLGIAAVDYIGLMKTSGRYDSRNHELGETCRQMKELATDLDIPLIVLSQLNRASENRTDKRPAMSDLRDSGDLEAHADVIAFLHRPGYYDRDNPDLRCSAELIISKQRNGDTPSIPLYFRRECGKFENETNTGERAA